MRKPNNRISNRKKVDMIVKQVLSMMDNTFFQERMVFCQQRIRAQHSSGLPHDQSYKTQRDTEVEEIQGHMVGGDMLCREDHLVKIQPVTKDQKYGHKGYSGIVPLGSAAHKNQQRAQKVDYQIQIEDAGIRSFKTGLEINSLLGDVRIPDEHELVEPEIGPEDRKGEHELTKVVQMLLVDILQVALVLDVDDKDGDQRQPGNKGTGKGVPAVHGREPVGIEAHQP